MTGYLHPLPVWPAPGDDDKALIVAAKNALTLPDGFMATIVPAVWGSPTRMLALREPAPFLHDHWRVLDPRDTEELEAALAWCFDRTISDYRAETILDTLTLVFGFGVIEHDPTELTWPAFNEGVDGILNA